MTTADERTDAERAEALFDMIHRSEYHGGEPCDCEAPF